ncbi:MAG: helix-turn-helix transcriptional regulator [Lewinellaceae bacterium]|nr:helix-turn-helix transcriptional regulator [Lewinellaceae bacterium]
MKPLPFKIPKTEATSFRIQVDEGPHFYDRLHYHPEWQLTAIQQGSGMLFLGNSFIRFQEGSVFLVGSNVPHLLKNDAVYFSENSPGVRATSIFFHKKSFGEGFFELPELLEIQQLLEASERGIWVLGEEKKKLSAQIESCLLMSGIDLFQNFLSLLGILCQTKTIQYLNEATFKPVFEEKDGQRLDHVFQYSFQHFAESIELAEVAAIANLSVSQFCRYFKLHTRKTYFGYLNELRIEAACKLLSEGKYSIAQVCYEVGFNNLSNFNRQFRKLKGITPSQFRKAFEFEKSFFE